jgi:hypothetical protein
MYERQPRCVFKSKVRLTVKIATGMRAMQRATRVGGWARAKSKSLFERRLQRRKNAQGAAL